MMSTFLKSFLSLTVFLFLHASAKKGHYTRDHCNKTLDINNMEVSSPEANPRNKDRPVTCWYRFIPFDPKQVIYIRFKKFKVGALENGTYCAGGYVRLIDRGLGTDGPDFSRPDEAGDFCGEIEHNKVFISENNHVTMLFHVDSFDHNSYFLLEWKPEHQKNFHKRFGPRPEFYPQRRGQPVDETYCEKVFANCRDETCYVQSPGYPEVYLRNLRCRYHITSVTPFARLRLQGEYINIDGQRCEDIIMCPTRPISTDCPFDYLRIYDGRTENARMIGTFCGMGRFPHDIVGSSSHLLVEFVSSYAGPLLNTGFHFTVDSVRHGSLEMPGKNLDPPSCNWVFSSQDVEKAKESEGFFFGLSHWYPPDTKCSYLIKGRPNEIVRLYFPNLRIKTPSAPIMKTGEDCVEFLTIFDSTEPEPSKILKMFCDTYSKPLENHDFVSSGNALLVQFESLIGSYESPSIELWAHFDFFQDLHYGEPVPHTLCDEVFADNGRPTGEFASPPNTLVYKRGEDFGCTYKFVADGRRHKRVKIVLDMVSFGRSETPCFDCETDRRDKLILWDPSSTMKSQRICLCENLEKPLVFFSVGHKVFINFQVDHRNALVNYFKRSTPVFKGNFSFIHGPECGPTNYLSRPEGRLEYPQVEGQPFDWHKKEVLCVWEIQVTRGRNLWLYFKEIKLTTQDCMVEAIFIYLEDWNPWMIFCQNLTNIEVPIIPSERLKSGYIRVIFSAPLGSSPSFKLFWTELYPHNMAETQKLVQDDSCSFVCPGSQGCIPSELVCNGFVNCPGNFSSILMDESSELCITGGLFAVSWWIFVVAGSGALIVIICSITIALVVVRKCK
ncbi:unnamed protein product [Darwinula stevensoni]|uniref:CUB domain-containing protein n=1 Tax=Darwinula stevensoni TaxID=69355 RepID=A0A7R9A509_9CRUS|nr:unnamed protein product [Darwinula stevensoni]CAG0885430.1 unnamed protein product [Darwinula stevensoni]